MGHKPKAARGVAARLGSAPPALAVHCSLFCVLGGVPERPRRPDVAVVRLGWLRW
eukprot:COSAG02_NODE_57196_length_281_cov_1.142857_1_plen_54_part_10